MRGGGWPISLLQHDRGVLGAGFYSRRACFLANLMNQDDTKPFLLVCADDLIAGEKREGGTGGREHAGAVKKAFVIVLRLSELCRKRLSYISYGAKTLYSGVF